MHSIDISKGERRGEVSAQWAMRPDDQRFTSLTDLSAFVKAAADASFERETAPFDLSVVANGTDLLLRSETQQVEMNHHSFDQLAQIARVPANYARRLPAQLAAVNLNYGLKSSQLPQQELYLQNGDATLLRGITSAKYGRILDTDVVDAVMQIAGNGTGDTHWKVPGTIDWGGQHGIAYNPQVDITKENTTLYASDRDVFLFLVDDMRPIEVGKLSNGDPDLMFRGFYVWNSEVGSRTFGVATMYLRGVCQNRNLWGVEGFNEMTFKHTSGAPGRFTKEAAPLLEGFSNGSDAQVVWGVKQAKAKVVSTDDDARMAFLAKLGFSQKQAKELVATSLAEEGKPQETLWDHAQAISALARRESLQDNRITLEGVAGKVLDMAL